MGLTFLGDVGHDGDVVHPFDFVGGAAVDPSVHEPDDCILWVEPTKDSAIVVVAAGMGNAIGHLEAYFDASIVARIAAGFLVGRLTSRPLDLVLPERARPLMLRGWERARRASPAAALADAFVETATAVPPLVAEAVDPHRRSLLRGMGTELAVGCFSASVTNSDGAPALRFEFGQRGAITVYRRRGDTVTSIAPVSTLREDYLRAGQTPPEDICEGIVTRLISASDPLDQTTLTAEADARAGDVFVFVTRGISEHVSAAEITECTAGSPQTIAALLVGAARRAERRDHQPTCAVVVVD